jgi:hypothetical protein
MSVKINLMPEGFREPRRYNQTKFLIGSLGFLGLVVLAFVLFGILTILTDKEVKSLDSEVEKVLEEISEAKTFDGGLSVDNLPRLADLLNNHIYWSKVFPEIERLTLPSVDLSNFSGNSSGGESSVSFSGSAANFKELARQVTAFRSGDVFEKVGFSSQGVSKEGGISFQITIKLIPNFLKELD